MMPTPKLDQGDGHAIYLPTPAEIAAGCLAIQATWDEEEEQNHRVVKNPEARIIGADRMPLWEDVGQTREKLRKAVPPVGNQYRKYRK